MQARLDALPSRTPDDTDWGFHHKELAAVKALLRQYADDVFAQRRYINTMSARYIDVAHGPTERSMVIEEYKSKLAASPGSAQLAYLYGLTLLGRHSPESIKLFDGALDKDPKFPWPHLALVQIYSSSAFRDKTKAAAHLKAFLDACPASFAGYQELPRNSDDKDVIRRRAAELRSLLEKRSDVHAIAAYQTLWALEFKATPPSEHDALRKKTALDVQRIRALNLNDKREWYAALEHGYKLANDPKNADWAKDGGELRYPNPWIPASLSKWFDGHHYPGPDATAEARRAYYSELLAETNNWIQERPNSPSLWQLRLDAMTNLEGIAPAEVEAATDRFLAIAQKNAGPAGPDSYECFSAIRALSKKHLQPARVVEMGQKGLERSGLEEKESLYDLYDEKERGELSVYKVHGDIEALGYVANAYIELKQPDQVQLTLAKMDERLQDLKSLVGDKKDHQKIYLGQVSAYWSGMARLAQLQRRKLDAMAFYENALLTRLEAEEKSVPGHKDELVEDAKKLWVSLGGTDEAWTMWYGRRANELARLSALRWEDANEPLAAFELADLNGKTWTLESLKGKTTFLNFWASW